MEIMDAGEYYSLLDILEGDGMNEKEKLREEILNVIVVNDSCYRLCHDKSADEIVELFNAQAERIIEKIKREAKMLIEYEITDNYYIGKGMLKALKILEGKDNE